MAAGLTVLCVRQGRVAQGRVRPAIGVHLCATHESHHTPALKACPLNVPQPRSTFSDVGISGSGGSASSLLVHWVAVPQAQRAQRINSAPASVCARHRRSSAAWPPNHRAHLAARAVPAQFDTAGVTHHHARIQRRGGRSKGCCVRCSRNELRPAVWSGCPAVERPGSPAPACPHHAACQSASRRRDHLHAVAALAP
jgi:hypothetical protein